MGVTDIVVLGVIVTVGVTDGDTGEGVIDGDTDIEGVIDGDTDIEGVIDGVIDGVVVVDGVALGVANLLSEAKQSVQFVKILSKPGVPK